ncbi:hypothetical protein B296_00006337 [Ensete ventricosum]|uniref:Uncharacterized protein n=1 Tax=Ensete ventricosum TaxID=4639 RepID=A0A427AG18_ENSVE|nr:hypothetical protein B296_00006337 [Ensete ventricosum]
MCNLPEQASDAPLVPDLRPLTHGTPFWQSGEASATYIRGVLLPRLASDLYILLSEVLMDGTAKAMVLNQHYQAALFDRVHDAGRVITSLDGKVTLLRQELQDLKEGGNPDALLDLALSKKALREDLPKRVVKKYKESLGFEMGIMRIGRVSLEFGYQLALALLQARHPRVEIELDPFVTLPVDADERPFDDSLPPPEE